MLGEAEAAAAKKLSENEARVTELTDLWKDRWKETQKILEVQLSSNGHAYAASMCNNSDSRTKNNQLFTKLN